MAQTKISIKTKIVLQPFVQLKFFDLHVNGLNEGIVIVLKMKI